MLAVAFDERIMREDRGYFCFPEVDIRIPFTPGMDALIKARLKPQVAYESMVTGKRYGGAEAVAAEIVQAGRAEDQVLSAAVERAECAGRQGRRDARDHQAAPLRPRARNPARR